MESLGVAPVSCQVMTRRARVSCRMLPISASTLALGRRVFAAGEGGGQLIQPPDGFGQGGAGQPGGLGGVQLW